MNKVDIKRLSLAVHGVEKTLAQSGGCTVRELSGDAKTLGIFSPDSELLFTIRQRKDDRFEIWSEKTGERIAVSNEGSSEFLVISPEGKQQLVVFNGAAPTSKDKYYNSTEDDEKLIYRAGAGIRQGAVRYFAASDELVDKIVAGERVAKKVVHPKTVKADLVIKVVRAEEAGKGSSGEPTTVSVVSVAAIPKTEPDVSIKESLVPVVLPVAAGLMVFVPALEVSDRDVSAAFAARGRVDGQITDRLVESCERSGRLYLIFTEDVLKRTDAGRQQRDPVDTKSGVAILKPETDSKPTSKIIPKVESGDESVLISEAVRDREYESLRAKLVCEFPVNSKSEDVSSDVRFRMSGAGMAVVPLLLESEDVRIDWPGVPWGIYASPTAQRSMSPVKIYSDSETSQKVVLAKRQGDSSDHDDNRDEGRRQDHPYPEEEIEEFPA